MFILNRFSRKNGTMNHSTQFFDIPSTGGALPQEVKNRLYAICDADANDASIDYAMCQAIDENGNNWKTEVAKPMPNA